MAEGHSTDDTKSDKIKRKRKQDNTGNPANSEQKESATIEAGGGKKKSRTGLPFSSLLWVLFILMALGILLFSKHSGTLKTLWTDLIGWSHDEILDEYIK